MIGTILSVIAALASVYAIWQNERSKKSNILRRIEKKRRKINDIDFLLKKTFGLNDNPKIRPQTNLDIKKQKLQKEIQELEKDL